MSKNQVDSKKLYIFFSILILRVVAHRVHFNCWISSLRRQCKKSSVVAVILLMITFLHHQLKVCNHAKSKYWPHCFYLLPVALISSVVINYCWSGLFFFSQSLVWTSEEEEKCVKYIIIPRTGYDLMEVPSGGAIL